MLPRDHERYWNEFWYRIAVLTLQTSLILYLILGLIERLQAGFVSFAFNETILLIIAIVAAIVTVIIRETPRLPITKAAQKERKARTATTLILILLPAMFVALALYLQLRTMGKLAVGIAMLAAVLTAVLVQQFLSDSNGETEEE